MKFVKNNYAVSQIIGYVFTLAITSVAITGAILATTMSTNEKTEAAASVVAKNIANQIADAVLNARSIKQEYIEANYSRTLDIPPYLVNSYRSYYIEITDKTVYVNSTDGLISETTKLYNTSSVLSIQTSGRILGSYGKAKIYTKNTTYIYKFDFEAGNSSAPPKESDGYVRVSDKCSPECSPSEFPNTIFSEGNWMSHSTLKYWKYCTPINITNPTERTLNDYQIMLRLDPSTFDYSTANSNGSDLRFVNDAGTAQDYWIETWNPRNTSTSRIWINVTNIPINGCKIYMFHGNPSAPPESNGSKTFLFFDDFSKSGLDTSKWQWIHGSGNNNDYDISDNMLVLINNSAIVSKYNLSNGIIETKARAITGQTTSGSDIREACMFARYDTTAAPPYVFLLFSGYNVQGDQSLGIKYQQRTTSGQDPLFGTINLSKWKFETDYNDLDTEWMRLTFLMNDTNTIIARYLYEDFDLDGDAGFNAIDFVPYTYYDGGFGLCTTNESTEAHYDWIYARKFEANTSDDANSYEEQYPTTHILATKSLNFKWNDTIGLDSEVQKNETGCKISTGDERSVDFVSSTANNSFNISNLKSDTYYSIIFAIGDMDRSIDGLVISGTGGNIVNIDTAAGDIKKNWFVAKSDGTGKIAVSFTDTVGNNYWNICWMTVEEGIRSINIVGEI